MCRKWFSLVGLAFAVAGADKLLGIGGYERLFADMGWSESSRRLVGAAEFTGGLMVAGRQKRKLGGMVLLAASAAMLTNEIRRDRTELAIPRGLMMLAAATALCPHIGWRRSKA